MARISPTTSIEIPDTENEDQNHYDAAFDDAGVADKLPDKSMPRQNGDVADKLPEKSVGGTNGASWGGRVEKYNELAKNSEEEKDEEEKKEDGLSVGVFEIFKYSTKRDRFLMFLGTICAMCHGSAFPLMILVFGEMVDLFVDTSGDTAAIEARLLDTMETYAIYFVCIGCGALVFGYGQITFWMIASERQTHRIRELFYRNVMRQDIGWFDTQETGQFNTRISGDISKIHDGIGDKIGNFFQWFTAFLAGFTIGFIYGWKLTLVTIAISPLLAGAAFMMTKLVALASGAELKAYAKAGAIAEEVLGAIRTVVAFGGQSKECERYEKNLNQARDLGIRKGMVNGATLGFVWLVMFGAYGLGFWYGAKLTRDEPENYTIGKVTIVFFGVLIGAFSLGSAAPNIQSFSVARGAAYVIFQIIYREPPIDTYSTEGMKLDHMQGNIELRNINFTYPSRPDAKILKGVNLSISNGQTVALVGASGCGKSTIVQLIQRFYDPEQGQITVDGHALKDINLKSLRDHVGIVSQEPVLFATTIAENIRYGQLDATEEDIQKAAKMANAHDFIMALPDKYETLVGERGAQLSGGQKQRVAIARALVRDPKILLLDEATSALDTESEGVVQDALEKASHGRTTIVIAHRLSTIKNADKIAGFKDGQIVEEGTHDQLMNKGGIYKQLVTSQTQHSKDDEEAELTLNPPKKADTVRHTDIATDKINLSEKTEDKEEEDKKVNASLGRILRINASEWYLILLGCFGSLVNGGLMPAFAIIFAEILGVFAESDRDKQEEKVQLYTLLFVGLGVLSFFTYFLQGYMFARAGETLTLRLRSMSFKALLRQEIAYFDDHENSIGALTTRLATDASQVQGAAGARLGQAIMSVCSILTGIIISFIYSWKLTLLILAFFPFIVIGGAIQMQILNGAAGKNKEALEAAGKVAVESIVNIRTVSSLSREEMFCLRFMQELQTPYRQALKKAHIVGLSFGFSQAVLFFAYGASFYLGAYLIKEGEINYIDVFKCFSAVVFGGMAVGEASSFAPDAAKADKSATEIFRLLDKELTINSESTEGLQPSEGEYRSTVTFSDVKFHYPTRPDVKVLQGLNLTVEPGQTVALVGSSGCGKSTTVQLIERFYDAEEGQVMLDRNNLVDLNIQWLRSQIGIVSQEPVLFDRTIRENIAYGDNSRDIPDAELIAAARKANIHEFITSLPEGYETNAGDKGSQLSGGQKQRIAIARALVRNPKILLLDEATSALDTESEKVVQEALDKAREGRTSIVIAHRLSTIQNSDKICVIRHGVVTEQGTHSDLMKKQGFYYKLNMVQARKK